jgi:hypothetical protein
MDLKIVTEKYLVQTRAAFARKRLGIERQRATVEKKLDKIKAGFYENFSPEDLKQFRTLEHELADIRRDKPARLPSFSRDYLGMEFRCLYWMYEIFSQRRQLSLEDAARNYWSELLEAKALPRNWTADMSESINPLTVDLNSPGFLIGRLLFCYGPVDPFQFRVKIFCLNSFLRSGQPDIGVPPLGDNDDLRISVIRHWLEHRTNGIPWFKNDQERKAMFETVEKIVCWRPNQNKP